MAGLVAIAVVLLAVFSAPLVLGSYVVVQGASRTVVLAWFWSLTALFIVVLLAGILGLLFTPA